MSEQLPAAESQAEVDFAVSVLENIVSNLKDGWNAYGTRLFINREIDRIKRQYEESPREK